VVHVTRSDEIRKVVHMLRRSLVALAAAALLFAAGCSDDGAGPDGAGNDGTEVDQSADGAAADDTGTADTAVEGGGGTSSGFCAQVAERPLTNDPEDAAEHYAKLKGVAPKHLQDDAALLERAYRELADNGDDASDIDGEGAIDAAIGDLVQYQKDICFG
jgi:hypothetical protein